MKHVPLFATSVLVIIFIQGCAVQKQLVPTGGSRADGTVKLSYEYGLFEAPKLDAQQGLSAAQRRCAAWGYNGAEPFGGSTQTCINSSNGGCNRWLASIEYQCSGSSHPLN
jgi:hypothetical protein